MEWVPTCNFRLFVKLGGASIVQKACFLEIKEYALNTSLKKRIFPIEIVKIDIWMIISYFLNYCCHINYSVYLIYMNFICLNILYDFYYFLIVPTQILFNCF